MNYRTYRAYRRLSDKLKSKLKEKNRSKRKSKRKSKRLFSDRDRYYDTAEFGFMGKNLAKGMGVRSTAAMGIKKMRAGKRLMKKGTAGMLRNKGMLGKASRLGYKKLQQGNQLRKRLGSSAMSSGKSLGNKLGSSAMSSGKSLVNKLRNKPVN